MSNGLGVKLGIGGVSKIASADRNADGAPVAPSSTGRPCLRSSVPSSRFEKNCCNNRSSFFSSSSSSSSDKPSCGNSRGSGGSGFFVEEGMGVHRSSGSSARGGTGLRRAPAGRWAPDRKQPRGSPPSPPSSSLEPEAHCRASLLLWPSFSRKADILPMLILPPELERSMITCLLFALSKARSWAFNLRSSSVLCPIFAFTNLWKSTTSLTVARFVPRNCKMISMNSTKVSSLSSFTLCSSSKIKSANPVRPMTSMPTSHSVWTTSLLSSTLPNSSFEIVPLPSSSIEVSTACNLSFT
mmetsp:Transcript_60341/g.197488  ORF Transcript_60341/g.197488 Transcript_60341/m.197488 type:complete len:298 (+) Transcript_60341:426-1319(+)